MEIIKYAEIGLDKVMEFFSKGFESVDEKNKVEKVEWFVDVAKGTAIFKLYIKEEIEKNENTKSIG